MSIKHILTIVTAFIIGIVSSSIFFSQNIRNRPTKLLEKVALNYPKNLDNSSAQWFMKKNLMGEWENLMFIFGYIDDRGVCNFMLDIAQETDPEIEFRCTDVN